MKYSNRHAFSLVEVTLALGIASFCLLALVGLLPVGIQATSDASEETQVTNLISEVVADLKHTLRDGTAETNSALYGIQIPAPTNLSRINEEFHPTLFLNEFGKRTDTRATSLEPYSSHTVDADIMNRHGNARYRVAISMQRAHAEEPIRATIQVSWPAAATLNNALGKTTVVTSFHQENP